MYWVCEECGWENEYSDAIKYTDCQCCGSPATRNNIAEATKALNRFHQEKEHRKREEAVRLKVKKQQQVINGAMARYVKVLRALPKVNLVATLIAIILIVASFVTGDIPGEELWERISSNTQEITWIEQLGSSIEMTNQLLSNQLSSHFHIVGSNSKALVKIVPDSLPDNASLLWDGVQSSTDSMGVNLSTIGDHILEKSTLFSRNIEFFCQKASANVTELFYKIFKR